MNNEKEIPDKLTTLTYEHAAYTLEPNTNIMAFEKFGIVLSPDQIQGKICIIDSEMSNNLIGIDYASNEPDITVIVNLKL